MFRVVPWAMDLLLVWDDPIQGNLIRFPIHVMTDSWWLKDGFMIINLIH